MRFDVTYYDVKRAKNSTIEFLQNLPGLIPNYKGEFSLVPEDVFSNEEKLKAWVKKIERNEANLWPVVRASKDKFGWVLLLAKYEGRNPEIQSSIDAYLVRDYFHGYKIESDRLFFYARFTETPFADARLVLQSFRDFSYDNCSHLKGK